MKKKILVLLLIMVFALFTLAACDTQGAPGEKGEQGIPGTDGRGISQIEKTSSDGNADTYTITFTDGTTTTFTVTNGNDGAPGNPGTAGKGIVSVEKTSTEGKTDSYTITFTDESTVTFTVTNGNDGSQGIQGPAGKGVVSVEKTSSEGKTDTYTITFTDETTTTFTITNGNDGSQGIQGPAGKGITGAEIDENGHLIIYFDDETTADAGKFKDIHPHGIIEKTIVEREATCAETGLEYVICETCGEVLHTYIIPKKEHAFADEYSVNNLKHWKEVSCGHADAVVKENHTLDENGVCTVCGFDQTQERAFAFEKITGKEEYEIVAYSGNIKTVYIPSEYDGLPVTALGINLFEDNSTLEKVVIPLGIKTIDSGAFMGCSNLKSVSLPDSLTNIGGSVFLDCACFETVDGVLYVDNWVYSCVDSEEFTAAVVRDGTMGIAPHAFEGCGYVTSITIPASVKHLGTDSFKWSGITSIVIPDGITTLPYGSLSECSALESVTLPGTIVSIGKWALSGCPNLKNIYFGGTSSDWESISKGEYWNNGSGSFEIHYAET